MYICCRCHKEQKRDPYLVIECACDTCRQEHFVEYREEFCRKCGNKARKIPFGRLPDFLNSCIGSEYMTIHLPECTIHAESIGGGIENV
jgi:hypothetical protein